MWFDGQADQFEERSGLPPAVGRSVARAVLDLSGSSGDEAILDVGTGTGAVGRHFAELPCRYVGLDLSTPMLAVFRQNLGPPPEHMLLLHADGDRPWPVGDRVVAVVLASRVAHHLRVSHFISEAERVCRPGGCLLLGQLRRDGDSLPSRLRARKRELLAEHGLHPRRGDEAVQEIVDACCARGARAFAPVAAARWTRAVSPRQLLTSWEGKPRLNSGTRGGAPDARQRAAVMNALTDWAGQEFGDLDRPRELAEEYLLRRVRLP